MKTNTAALTCTSPIRKGSTLPCPRCGEEGASIALDLIDLHGDEALHCNDCDGRFSVAEIRDIIARWAPVLAWMDSFPIDCEE